MDPFPSHVILTYGLHSDKQSAIHTVIGMGFAGFLFICLFSKREHRRTQNDFCVLYFYSRVFVMSFLFLFL